MKRLLCIPIMLTAASCATLKVEPIKIESTHHVVVDVNVRVERELEDFFAFEEQPQTSPATQPAAATQPQVPLQ